MTRREPAFLDKVWDEQRKVEGKQPNGFILEIFREEEEVLVQFFDEPRETETYSFDQLADNYANQTLGYLLKL